MADKEMPKKNFNALLRVCGAKVDIQGRLFQN